MGTNLKLTIYNSIVCIIYIYIHVENYMYIFKIIMVIIIEYKTL